MNKKETIIVKTQEELDLIPEDCDGLIEIRGKCSVKKRYKNPIKIYGDYEVNLYNNTIAVAADIAKVRTYDNSFVLAYENATVYAYDNSKVEAAGRAKVYASDNSFVKASMSTKVWTQDCSKVCAGGPVEVAARDNSQIIATYDARINARGNSKVKVYGNCWVSANENSEICAFDASFVIACGNSTVNAYGSSLVDNSEETANVSIHADAHIVKIPRTALEYIDYYNIEVKDNKAILYKAVHKSNGGEYYSDFDNSFIYKIGEVVKSECDTNLKHVDACGIYATTLIETKMFGNGLDDKWTTLELEVDIDKMVIPESCYPEVRVPEAKVLREVPPEELLSRED